MFPQENGLWWGFKGIGSAQNYYTALPALVFSY